jgi:hypothetical protein
MHANCQPPRHTGGEDDCDQQQMAWAGGQNQSTTISAGGSSQQPRPVVVKGPALRSPMHNEHTTSQEAQQHAPQAPP